MRKIIYAVAKHIVLICLMYVRKIKGLENLPKKGAFIIAANHGSAFDTVVIPSVFIKLKRPKVHYVAKKELFKGYFARELFYGGGCIPIDREAGGKEAMKYALEALENGKIIGMFPEGTRTRDGKLQKAKTGIARLALWAKVPVIPVGLDDPYKIWPKGKLLPRFGKFEINIGKPIYLDKYYKRKESKKLYREIADMIMKEVAKLCNKEYKL